MPASNEIVSNRPLSGSELRQIMLKDVGNILDKDGMFSPHIGYGRVSYEIIIKLHIDNPSYPNHTSRTVSHNPARNETNEALKHIETAPLKNPSPDAAIAGLKRERVIDSPNHARLEHELPVSITRRDPADGVMKEEQVQYDNHGLEPGPVKDTDISEELESEWGKY